MKTRMLHFYLTTVTSLGFLLRAEAQEVIPVHDQVLIQTTAQGHAEITYLLQQQLEEARSQTEKLEQQLALLGMPAEVEVAGVGDVEAEIGEAASNLPTTAEIAAEVEVSDGSLVFDETVYGLYEPIESEAVLTDDSTAPRDPELYRKEAAMLGRIKDYQETRDTAVARRIVLQETLAQALQAIVEAETFAEVQKQKAIIDLIQQQIASAEREVAIAAQDVDILEREMINQERVAARARQEDRQLEVTKRTGVERGENPIERWRTMFAPRSPRWGPGGATGGTEATGQQSE